MKAKTKTAAKVKSKAKSIAEEKPTTKSKTAAKPKTTAKTKATSKIKAKVTKQATIKTTATAKIKTVEKKAAEKKTSVKGKVKNGETSTSSKKVTQNLSSKAKTVEKPAAKAKVATKKAAAAKKSIEVKKRAPRPPPSSPKPRTAAEPSVTPYRAKVNEEYMNEEQRAHFGDILLEWKMQLMEEVDRTVSHMKDEASNYPDPADRASQEEEFSLELKTRDRERKLIRKIDKTIDLIDQNDYGYCESCGIEIGVRRLEARPTATQCIDCKTLDEIKERQIRG